MKEYEKEWKLYLRFPMQFVRNCDAVQIQVSPTKSEKGDASKWEVSSVLEDEVEVSDYLHTMMRNGSNHCNQSVLSQITKKRVDTFMSKVPPLVPNCLFMAKFVSHAKRRPAELQLEIKLNGSQPSTVVFSVDVDSQGVCIAQLHVFQDFNP